MASRATLTAWRASAGTSRFSSICPATLPSAPAFLSVPKTTSIHIQKRSLIGVLKRDPSCIKRLPVVDNKLVVEHSVCPYMNDTGAAEDDSQISALRINMMPPKFRLKRDVIFTLEDLFVLPFGLDVGILGVGAYYLTRLKKAQQNNVLSIFGPDPGSKEGELQPEKVVRCIAHRGAGLDVPENTLEAFKYCVERDCYFVELDVRSSKDGQLVLLHDQGLERLAGASIADVHTMDWEAIKNIDVGATHPNRHHFKEVNLCLLDEALDYLLENKVRMIIDIKGEDKQVINGILKTFSARPSLYQHAAVTCFNPLVLYQIRKKDPQIVGVVSYRPYCFSALEYDAEGGPNKPRYGDNLPLHAVLRTLDALHALMWRWAARWCGVSAVLLHKDIVSPSEVQYWRSLGVRCAGWCVNRPLEKLYWRGVLKAPYLANTLLGEPDIEKKSADKGRGSDESLERAGPLVDRLLEAERNVSSGQN